MVHAWRGWTLWPLLMGLALLGGCPSCGSPPSLLRTERTVFHNQDSGETRCDWPTLKSALDDWAQSYVTTWQGERETDEIQRRVLLTASILFGSTDGRMATVAQAQFAYRQRGRQFAIELMLTTSKNNEGDTLLLRSRTGSSAALELREFRNGDVALALDLDGLWARIDSACHCRNGAPGTDCPSADT